MSEEKQSWRRVHGGFYDPNDVLIDDADMPEVLDFLDGLATLAADLREEISARFPYVRPEWMRDWVSAYDALKPPTGRNAGATDAPTPADAAGEVR